jgi:hypothetical protein
MNNTIPIPLEIYYNPIWVNTEQYVLLFMAEIPKSKIISTKEELLLYVPTRVQKLVIQWRMMNEKFDYLLYDYLDVPDHYLPANPNSVEIVQAILETDLYNSWKAKFLNDNSCHNNSYSYDEAIRQFEETTLEQYILDGLLNDAIYE